MTGVVGEQPDQLARQQPKHQNFLFWYLLPVAVAFCLSALALATLGNYLHPDSLSILPGATLEGSSALPRLAFEALLSFAEPASRLPMLSLFQQTLLVFGVVLLCSLFATCYRATFLGVCVALAWALIGRNYLLAQTTSGEPFFVFTIALFLWAGCRWLVLGGWFSAIVCGFSCGVFPAFGTVGFVAVLVACFAWLFSPTTGGWRSSAQLFAMVAVFVASMAGFLGLNERHGDGKFSLGGEPGFDLLERLLWQDGQLSDGPAGLEITRMWTDPHNDLSKAGSLRDFQRTQIANGMGPKELDRLMFEAASERIRQAPVAYVWSSFAAMWELTTQASESVPVGLSPEYYEQEGLHWMEVDATTTQRASQFPTRHREAEWGGRGYSVFGSLCTGWLSRLVSGWWVLPLLAVSFLVGLWSREPGLLLASGFAAGILLFRVAAQAPEAGFWDALLLPFLVAVALALRWVFRMRLSS